MLEGSHDHSTFRSFVVGWLRTEDSNYLSTPLEVSRTLPRRAQELLGYAAHDAIAAGGGYLGTVDLLDPVELIAHWEDLAFVRRREAGR